MTKIKRWNTPVSDVSRLWVYSLNYNGTLLVSCGYESNGVEKKLNITFGERPIFRDIQEEFMSPLWETIFSGPEKIGWTFILEQSRWLQELEKDGIFFGTMKGCKHYVISTEDDVIEVITKNEPIFTEVP